MREQIEHILRDTEKILALHIQCTSMAFSSFGLLEKLTKKHVLPHIAQTFQTRLISDFQNIKTVEQGIAIWELAESVRNIPSVARLLLNGGDYETILAKLKTNAEASDFLQKWQTFIDNFGNRSSQEFELSVPKWDTDPSFVLDNVKQILKNHHPDPRGNLAQQQVTSKKNTKQTKQQIKTKKAPWRGWLFERYVRAYRLFVPLRENLKYALIERFNILRKLMLLYGEWLVHKRYIGDKEDIFFLE
ncbi:MAG: hypothetical protein GWN62_19065, partial [Aliifodinibius sp.]|nr:hypothetical protein [Fodinibius sp.]